MVSSYLVIVLVVMILTFVDDEQLSGDSSGSDAPPHPCSILSAPAHHLQSLNKNLQKKI